MVVKLFNIAVPDTFNELLMVVILFIVVVPDTFNELLIAVLLLIGWRAIAHSNLKSR